MMSESSKRHSKFLSLIFILKCLSKASVIKLGMVTYKYLYEINDSCHGAIPNKHLQTRTTHVKKCRTSLLHGKEADTFS